MQFSPNVKFTFSMKAFKSAGGAKYSLKAYNGSGILNTADSGVKRTFNDPT
jgi:hypothetical protein